MCGDSPALATSEWVARLIGIQQVQRTSGNIEGLLLRFGTSLLVQSAASETDLARPCRQSMWTQQMQI